MAAKLAGLALAVAIVQVVLAPAASSGAASWAPRRIVSLNLCADPLLVALADPDQVLALSQYARDPQMSPVSAKAARYGITGGSAEALLALKPDLVLATGPRRTALRDLLRRHGVRVVDIPQEKSLPGIEKAMTLVAAVVGHPERGGAQVAALEARLKAVGPPPGRGRVAAYYQRRGYLTGTGTLTDSMFKRVGLVNLATRLHRPALSQLSLEEMALARPDFLVMQSATAKVTDRGTEMLHHPVLDAAVPEDRRLYIPEALTVCGGPDYADAVALLAREVREADALNTRSLPAPSRRSGTGVSRPPSR